jgi:hypothetical protein
MRPLRGDRDVTTSAIDALGAIPDAILRRPVGDGAQRRDVQFLLYAALRREQAAAVVAVASDRAEPEAIMAFARSANRELVDVLAGRPDNVLDAARDGEWTLRDLLRHAIAVELRYCQQVLYAAERRDDEPLAIPVSRLPCDRLSPPEPEYAATRTGSVAHILTLVARARQETDARLHLLTSTALTRPSLWGDVEIDVRERMHQIGVHLVEVVVQAEKMLGASGGSEAGRIARHIALVRRSHEAVTDRKTLAGLDANLESIARAASDA